MLKLKPTFEAVKNRRNFEKNGICDDEDKFEKLSEVEKGRRPIKIIRRWEKWRTVEKISCKNYRIVTGLSRSKWNYYMNLNSQRLLV